ncbi:class I SAM-dependent methyltransferase [Halobacillus yeomjeoni]|uniref:class I SAM-dependent methyltransferase n=1 Tax=Halobacillus yeomjeoni TaxID=311194 RepID=UPI001CD1CDD5|nr:class I SAM-dependent methyltransferase [Halobacillus yeomjeoni]MCA0985003.1 class I SAM-dependent methyltransferase [Halobacillus yeomjeoni]
MSDDKQRVKDTFSKNAESYVTSTTHKNQSDLDLMVEWAEPQSSWTALDIATGGGHVAKEMSRWVDTVFATDLTKKMLENTSRHLQAQENIHYIIADAEELPFIDEYFDLVTCRIAPHHFPEPDRFIEEVTRVLKPQGRFLMVDNIAPEHDELDHFYNTFEKMRDESHVRALKISEWKKHFQFHHLSITQEQTRRKTLPFSDWVTRTLDEAADQQRVADYFLSASKDIQSYFDLKKEKQWITSFTIDEWAVSAEKK